MISRLLRRLPGRLVGRFAAGMAAALTAAPAAFAACAGEDLMARLEAERPEAHAGILAAGAEVENGEARFWQVERAGAAPSWLFGTYHDTGSLETLTPAVEAAFGDARAVAFELHPSETAALELRAQTDPTFVFETEGRGIAARLPDDLRVRAEAILATRGMTLQIADQLRPWMLFSLLGVPACQLAAMAGGAEVMDVELTTRAEAAGKTILGLETYEEALGAFGAIDPDLAVELAADQIRMAEREEDIRRTMLGLYATGEIGRLSAFTDWLATEATGRVPEEAERLAEAFEMALLDQRNRKWMTPLVPALEEGGVFVAVGALHLPGEAGLVTLLRERGFTVTPLDE